MALALEFDYLKPADLKAALEMKAQYGEKARFLAGGTDLVNNMDEEMLSPEVVIDLKGIESLKRLEYADGHLRIGSLVTFTELMESQVVTNRFPLLWEAASEVASISVRNRATMAGNLCSCVPCMDSAPALLVHGAQAKLRSAAGGERMVPIEQLAAGPRRTVLKPDEILEELVVPETKGKSGWSYAKLKRYRGEDLSQAGVAVLVLSGWEYRVAFGSVGPVPVRAASIEKLLAGKVLSDSLVEEAKNLVAGAISPITDIRATREYRLHMCQVMLARALDAAVARLTGSGPELGCRLV